MKINIDTVKGFKDSLPPQSQLREKIKKAFQKNAQKAGFQPLETPIIEYEEVVKGDSLPSEGEDEAVRDRFKLEDRAGRNLSLRYEFTFQLARIFKQNPNLKLPFKRFQIGPVFRDEPIKQGRTRQFVQCDIDVMGDDSRLAEAECLSVINNTLRDLNIKETKVELNNRKLMNAILDSVQIKKPQQVLRELDKLNKIPIEDIKVNLRKVADVNQILTLFKLLEKDLKFFKENGFEGAQEIEALIELCEQYKIKAEYNPTLMRGFAYYTGNIFEVLSENGTSLMGGGRFDNLAGKYIGRQIPAVGCSFSLEALIGLLPELKSLPVKPASKALIISLDQTEEAIQLAQALRKNNIPCSITEDKPGKALEYANSYAIPYTIFIGQAEIVKKKLKLKDMNSGDETLLSEKQLLQKLAKA
jgi:histidyl-tRNA synthetase